VPGKAHVVVTTLTIAAPGEAQQRAARMVNKARREHSETKAQRRKKS